MSSDMSDTAISVEKLGKRYQIAHQHDPYGRLTESLWNAIRSPARLIRKGNAPAIESFWALRDVSFEISPGDVVGVIGRNGAGKTTLLKILSRITEPTEGSARLRGRVGSLLEVGTGFHPELTGRENVFMSGAVLGMRRADITRRFDEIVEFAGVEQFLDTPVKRYSSGMQVRLGFAVAAHLEPDILFIDEVLAVGDAEFQKKCLGKMSEIGQQGRTILFVSHSMPAVLRLCDRALLLDGGRVIAHGPSPDVVRSYLEADVGQTSHRSWNESRTAPGDEVARLRSIRVHQQGSPDGDTVQITQPIDVEVEYASTSPGHLRPSVNLHFFNDQNICLFVTNDFNNVEWSRRARRSEFVQATCHIPANFLAEGRVTVTVAVSSYNPLVVHAIERDAVAFHVVDRSEGSGVRGPYVNEWPGVVRPMLEWDVSETGERS
jgi:lipopolysaccharide transport system ATP-binding protein